MKPSILLFDLGNVIVDWSPLRLYEKIFDDAETAEWFVTHVCNMEWHVNHDRGVTMDDNAKPLIEQYPEHENAIRAWKSRWLEMFNGYEAGADILLNDLKAEGHTLYALTNMPAEKWQETADAHPALHLFEDVIISGVEKVVKPDPRIFEITIERIGCASEDVFFTDDSLKNIAAADKFGFTSHHFQSVDSLRNALKTHQFLKV